MKVLSYGLLAAILLVKPVHASDLLQQYLELAVGSFDTSQQAARDDRYADITWHITEIWPGDSKVRWTYAENWAPDAERPYRQRITRFQLAADGSIQADGFLLPEQEAFMGAWQQPERFAALKPEDLQPVVGCTVYLVKTGAQRFEGATQGQQCRNSHRGASYMISQTQVSADGFVNWDRGFSANGDLVWGPAAGGYQFRPVGQQQCNEPVIMVVYGEIFDRAGFGRYVSALAESGLYQQHQAYHLAFSPAVAQMEGEPPASRGMVLARFPCLQAAKDFWYSEAYQAIIPHRQGVAEFEVSFLRELPVPAYVH
ncbi:CpcT/CpeT family chromophore lyase [Alkalimonas sp.]|uniref:CpcT/CpeT family chromophore lyase n=1 Tax=Alkalimonas sp. TaxID=1872453 RepID=UPI00263B1096|nr:CpcT/CpeT family chromophore lyase [Alkalimonas sp.]MCC5825048.1 DUF1330 domain-containing protein [Alkalimonas sp.]